MKARGKLWVDMLEDSDDSGDERGGSNEDLTREDAAAAAAAAAAEKDKAEQRIRRRRFNLKRLIRVLHISRPPKFVMAILGKR